MQTATAPLTALEFARSRAKRKASAEKDKTPEFSIPDLEAQCRQFSDLSRALKDLEAQRRALAADLMAAVEPLRLAHARKTGAYAGSVRVNGLLYVTCNNTQKAFKQEECDEVARVFGDLYPTYLKESFFIVVDIAQVPIELQMQLEAVGAEIKVETHSTKQLHTDRTMSPDIAALADQCPMLAPIAYFKE